MNTCLRRFAASQLAMIAIGAALLVAPLAAQEDPFGPTPKPATAEASTAPATPRPTGRLPAVVEREPLAIEMLRASNPSSPEELLAAARTAFQFGHPVEAKKFLAKLLAERPEDDALAPLTARFGAILLELSHLKDLQPEGQEVAAMVQQAAERVARDQSRITAAIPRIASNDTAARQAAIQQLAQCGVAALNPLLQVLADPARAAEHANIRLALVHSGAPVETPLIAALDSTNESLKNQIIAVLGRMGSSRAVPFLVRPALDPQSSSETRELAAAVLRRIRGSAPDLYEAEKYFTGQIPRLLAGDLPFEADQNDRIQLWTWNESTQQVVPGQLPRQDAGLLLAARLASDLYVLKNGEPAAQRLMLVTNLELAKVLTGFSQPISTAAGTAGAAALAAGPRVLNNALSEALRIGKSGAAAAAAELLGKINDASVLETNGSESPLAQALRSSDRRVRLAAALAAVKIAPGGQFSGAGRLGETLAWFVATSGADSVLIGHPRGEEAQSLVGFVNALGYSGEGTYHGRALADRAFANPDFTLLLISDAIDGPPVEELVQWLRRDYRTARRPVGIMARGIRLLPLENAFADDPYTTVFPRIHSVEVCAVELNKLLSIAGRNWVTRDERLTQARSALASLKILAENPAVFAQYDLMLQEGAIVAALDNAVLAADAAELLIFFPTPKAQAALLNAASQSGRLLADRQAAASAFAASIKQRGLLLTQSQIAQQYAHFNASRNADQPTQELLGSLLDAIEAPALARGDLTARGDPKK